MTATLDLRSDTVTRPTPAMRQAMAEALVGDDVYLEDPTVNRLQETTAELFGFEAALFVPTGSMGNQICVKLHTQPGQEVLLDVRAHIYNWELAMPAAFSGVLPRLIQTANGHPTWEQLAAAIQPKTYYRAQTGLVCLENTHNMAGGTIMPVAQFREICEQAHAAGLKVHLDGARIFNAAIALGLPVAELVQGVDSVMFCLSKGLGAPIGSMICGSREFIERARALRKMLGGGMRQVGVLAAAGLVALAESPAKLAVDHENARFIACEIAELPGVLLDPASVVTNIVIADVSGTGMTATTVCERLAYRGVLAGAVSTYEVRFVTHYDVDTVSCRTAVQAMRRVLIDLD
ncbi:MAG: aminotransferase class I/II-fold pyridoxal phosphate-dependent enzyme [Blastocatellia bacterium]|nr:aminotransferase class I/II-fold pyridoxal phosphate-dependent enzyme [Blastocatellia bacterium]HNG96123.1 GntG family PLP-dependent aldolase [Acidobacteriota bacterium]